MEQKHIKIRVIIVDDEKKARETIRNIIRLYCQNVEVVAEAANIKAAAAEIASIKPDLIFLDINMPGGTGFDLLKQLPKIDFKIVFITAYEEYALRAFKFSALDYLLKPINPDELIAAIANAQAAIEKENFNTKLHSFLENIDTIKKEVKKIVLKTSETIHIISVQDIIRCESERNYTTFFLNEGKKIVTSNTLKEYDEMLSPYRFFRIHHSHLINIDYVISFEKKEGGYFLMKDKSCIPFSAGKKEILLTLIERL
jgi:two-component system LytT family response regulator